MSGEQPTGDAGASVTERLEKLIGGEEPATDQPGDEAAPGEAVEVPTGDAQDEVDGPQYELPDVAKVLGLDESMLDVDEDGSLKIKTKIDGKEGTAKLQDLVKSYQLQGHIDAKVRHVAEQERHVVERVQQYETFAQTKFQELENLTLAAQHILQGEYAQVDWDRVYDEDPVGFPKRRFEFEKRQGQLQHLMQNLNLQKQQVGEALRHHQAQELTREAQRLPTLVPEWTDTTVREKEGAEMRQWLQQKGASESAINALRDAGLVNALRAGMLAERNAPKVAEVEKKVRAAPKLVRPGSGTNAADRASESARGLKQTIRASGGKKGIQEWLIATGKV